MCNEQEKIYNRKKANQFKKTKRVGLGGLAACSYKEKSGIGGTEQGAGFSIHGHCRPGLGIKANDFTLASQCIN
jgi:hypothetical protein